MQAGRTVSTRTMESEILFIATRSSFFRTAPLLNALYIYLHLKTEHVGVSATMDGALGGGGGVMLGSLIQFDF